MSGTINFTNYSVTNRVPGVFEEVDPSHANTGGILQTALIIGQQLATGTLVSGVPVLSLGINDTASKAGQGSMLAKMLARYRKHDPYSPVWLLPLADDPSASAATGTMVFSGTATAAGTLPVYVGDDLTSVGVTSGMTAAQLATAVAAAINANVYLPVTAAVASATVTVTAKNKGAAPNDIVLAVAPLGAAAGQSIPAGITVAITAMAGGATNPSLTTPLLNLGAQPFDFIAMPYIDSVSTAALTAFLNFTTGRWSPTSMIYGHAFAGFRGTYGAAITFLSALNDPNLTVMPFAASSLTPYWLWAAALAGAAGQALQGDNCVVPFRQVPLYVSPPAIADQFTWQQQNQLLYTGGSVFTVNPDGSVSPLKVITTYQTNAAGAADNSYLNVERMFTLAQVLRLRRAFLQTQFGRKALVSNTVQIPEGSTRVNAATIQAAVVAYQYWLQNVRGLVQNADTFANNVVVNNAGNGLVEILAPDDLTNQLDIIAVLVQFVSS